ncbi:DUF3224 domain-containing protein [Saccharothrix syringae]|uniref:DUF3224 family protein n=1 Tax=Saccharothrix syringae TaxID=103733 RepID=A0A5Q0H996_SACSY|nr:DUF3224 domain-containing protein [Saccharothrix syringae]QFZ22242.1 DUF3224 family protein [Saccharothrix syringae]
MTTHATAAVEMKSWTEHTWDGRPHEEVTGPKQTTGTMTTTYTGDLEGTGELRFLMAYPDDESCDSVGHEVVTGVLAGREGTLVLRHVGDYRDGVARAEVTVVSAGGGLSGLRGTGRITWRHGEPGRFELDHAF